MTPFETIWILYDYKVGRKKAEAKWAKLSKKNQQKCLEHIPKYIKIAFTDGTFPGRKHLVTYLNGECWNDEIKENKEPVYQVSKFKEEKPTEVVSEEKRLHYIAELKGILKKHGKIGEVALEESQDRLKQRFESFKRNNGIFPPEVGARLLKDLRQSPDKYEREIKYMER